MQNVISSFNIISTTAFLVIDFLRKSSTIKYALYSSKGAKKYIALLTEHGEIGPTRALNTLSKRDLLDVVCSLCLDVLVDFEMRHGVHVSSFFRGASGSLVANS